MPPKLQLTHIVRDTIITKGGRERAKHKAHQAKQNRKDRGKPWQKAKITAKLAEIRTPQNYDDYQCI